MGPLNRLRELIHKVDLLPFFLWPHKVKVIEIYDPATRKLKCGMCGRYFAMSDRYGAILPWDDDYERIICQMYAIPRTKT